ncbi:MAG TPA: MaoC/PaaZ C-terminal domain-containing protein [Oligoflexus sp.]|uniref:MaoC/PaaZ C-terminal domain-containing protein n=1 Tax=Oligoflexus sp. TaxID=1971216 RepID=UPI002D2E75FD|nr:MaoC/PaaZ C-terminal domain-containing protein [Oligoflexus sp.]HYX32713.1 MaoC/PaaZ C-terminal domain-containing protein [Oligoflexus sp.]
MEKAFAKKKVFLKPVKGAEYPRYYSRLVFNLFRRQRLSVSSSGYPFAAAFAFPESLKSRWDQLFLVNPRCPKPLQMIYNRLSRDYLFEALGKMQLNFANIMQLGIDVELSQPFTGFVPSQDYHYASSLKEVLHLNHDRALLKFSSIISDEQGEAIVVQRDTMILNNLKKSEIERLDKSAEVQGETSDQYRGLSKQEPEITLDAADWSGRYFLSSDTGMRYGVVSGDLNPLHTAKIFSKLLGHRGSFVQGAFTANLVLKFLMNDMQLPIKSMSVIFTRPAYAGQMITFVVKGNRFELHCQRHKLLAKGYFTVFP